MKKKTVILGISGGIAAVKTPQLVKLLKRKGFRVECILTRGAKYFIQLTGQDFTNSDHIKLAQTADLILICPATANLLAKLAHGLADDFLTTVVLASRAPVLLCPAMNTLMWENPAVRENLQKLISRGFQIIGPVCGRLACGDEGIGRLEELSKIVAVVGNRLKIKDSLKSKKILVTAGPTREPIDDIRYITNSSSGKMGAAIAAAAVQRGAAVKLLMGQTDFVTAKDLQALVKQHAPNFDIIFHAAAVGDFAPVKLFGKLSSRRPLSLKLKPQPKILAEIKKINPKICLIGFKAEYGLDRLGLQAGAQATVVNDVSRPDIGFGSDDNEVTLVLPDKKILIRKAPKTVIAETLLDLLARYYHW